jgi:hypothetical protein
MALNDQDRKKLWGRSGNVCSYPNCGTELAKAGGATRVLGEEAHIKGEKSGAARFDSHQSAADGERYENRILVCPTHHVEIDSDEATWTVEKLHEVKLLHEQNVERSRQFPDLMSELRDMVQRYGGPDPNSESAAQEIIGETTGTRTVRIDAKCEEGLDTGIDVRRGQRIALYARGLITFDGGHNFANPEGVLCNDLGLAQMVVGPSGALTPTVWPNPDAYPTDHGELGIIGSLFGWIGSERSAAFRTGAKRELYAPNDGRLFLAVNDARGTYSDNDGEFRVDIRVTDPPNNTLQQPSRAPE